jgi:cytochrome c biogenesis factor
MTLSDTLQSVLLTLADTLPWWRDSAIVILAGIVIGALWLYAEATG